MLTARGEQADRVRGLDTGADDYVTKPFAPEELIARIRAVMRRARLALSEERLTYGVIEMNLTEHKVARNNRPVVLGPTEFRLLRHFMEHPGRVFSRDQLIDSVWGYGIFIDSRTVDVHIRRLRKALNGKDEQDVIRTGRSVGYALDAEAAIA
jgi:two-component system phosphate regulon response regulator PhoB